MALVTLKCPQCGGQLKVDKHSKTVTCSYCGTEHLVVENGGGRLDLETPVRCPVCGRNDLVQKVSVLEGTGSPLSSKLSPPRRPLRIKMPTEPNRKEWLKGRKRSLLWGGAVLGLIYLMLLSSALGNLEGETRSLGGTFFLLALAALGTWLFLGWRRRHLDASGESFQRLVDSYSSECVRLRKIAEEEWGEYRRAMDGWSQLYYCRRDDCVFLPGSETCAPPDRMREYLKDVDA